MERLEGTVVIQSHRQPLPYDWLYPCIDSVKFWAAQQGFEYLWLGDELFDNLSERQRRHTAKQPVVASDLARLQQLKKQLDLGAERVIWCDADTLILNPARIELPLVGCALGRELWVQYTSGASISSKVFSKVHNAFMVFCSDDSFLPFYLDTAAHMLDQHPGPYVSQFIGPKLLTALHNIVQFPVIESAGVLSPAVIVDLNGGGGECLNAYCRRLTEPPAALNLCASSVRNGELSEQAMSSVIDLLVRDGAELFAK